MASSKSHTVVVGAGIIGLATAYHLLKEGAQVTVIDRDPDGDKASFGNAGAIAVTEMAPASMSGTVLRVLGWMLDPLGPLTVRPSHALKLLPWLTRFARVSTGSEVERLSQALAAINARVYDDLLPMLNETGLQGELHRHGALSVYETEQGYQQDAAEWACKQRHGVVTQELTGDEARHIEPALGPRVRRAVLTPQWSYVSDPKSLARGLKDWLTLRGVAFRKDEVRNIVRGGTAPLSVELSGERVLADHAVVAAGAWSGVLARRLGDRVLLESERGYNMTIPSSGITLHRQLIFAERKFVATPLRCGLRIGGAAEFGGLKAAPNYKRSQKLAELARLYLPQLKIEGETCWAGHRPATPDSLPVIGPSKLAHVFYAFGHGHLGLTQAATTGRLISDLICAKPAAIDMSPYAADRFDEGRP
jgi:D-amino-acid dehydrogenase